jgi:lipoprotein-anchoring transpeptidase ErfK/SrfK
MVMPQMPSRRKNRVALNALAAAILVALLASPAPPPVSARIEAPATIVAAPVTTPVTTGAAPAALRASAPAKPVFAVASPLSLDAPIRPGDYAWNAEGVPHGALTVVVDLEWRYVYVYRGGIEIGRSSMIYGADDKPTPTGVYPILQRKRHHISNLYGAPMPYMLRLTNDGISIHASEEIRDEYATHGCIGLPDEFAAALFAEAKVGDYVLVTKNWQRDIYGAQPFAPVQHTT